jgi:hypothetical protein
MKHKLFHILLGVMFLSACNPAASRTVVNTTDDFIRLYGDDVVRLTSQSADDAARQASRSSDEAAQYWDDILRQSPQAVDQVPSTLLYGPGKRLYPEQEYLLAKLQEELQLGAQEAALYLEGVCNVTAWASLLGEYPSQSSTEQYIKWVAEANDIKTVDFIEFAQSVTDFSIAIIEDQNFDSRSAAAKIVFDGLCLLAE